MNSQWMGRFRFSRSCAVSGNGRTAPFLAADFRPAAVLALAWATTAGAACASTVERAARPLPEDEAATAGGLGIDTSELVGRERRELTTLLSSLYAPCPSQAVPLSQCLREHRNCVSCLPAAELLRTRIVEGSGASQAEAAYKARFFAPKVRIDLTDAPARGPADAAVTVVAWSDFECPACQMAMPLLDKISSSRQKTVRLVHKFYPLKQHLLAENAARAAIAAFRQDHYWEMEKLLFAHEEGLDPPALQRYAKQLGLDETRFSADMAAEATTALLAKHKTEADAIGLSGTPFIVVNGTPFESRYFQLARDLEGWVDLEVQLAAGAVKPPI